MTPSEVLAPWALGVSIIALAAAIGGAVYARRQAVVLRRDFNLERNVAWRLMVAATFRPVSEDSGLLSPTPTTKWSLTNTAGGSASGVSLELDLRPLGLALVQTELGDFAAREEKEVRVYKGTPGYFQLIGALATLPGKGFSWRRPRLTATISWTHPDQRTERRTVPVVIGRTPYVIDAGVD